MKWLYRIRPLVWVPWLNLVVIYKRDRSDAQMHMVPRCVFANDVVGQHGTLPARRPPPDMAPRPCASWAVRQNTSLSLFYDVGCSHVVTVTTAEAWSNQSSVYCSSRYVTILTFLKKYVRNIKDKSKSRSLKQKCRRISSW